jgi:hypothetical protein
MVPVKRKNKNTIMDVYPINRNVDAAPSISNLVAK